MDEFNTTPPWEDSFNISLSNWTLEFNNSTSSNLTMEQVAILFNVYYTPILVLFGSIGNLLSVYVFYKSTLWLQSTSQYMSTLAISDTIFLIHLLPPWLNAVNASKLFHYKGFCQLIVFTSYATCSLSSWLVVAFTVERFVAVLLPLKRFALCTVKRARFIIVVLIIAAFLVNIPILNFVKPNNNDCNVSSEYVAAASRFNMADTLTTFTIPLILIGALNVWIMIAVWRMGQARERAQRAQHRITQMLVAVSSVYVILNLPAYTMRVLGLRI